MDDSAIKAALRDMSYHTSFMTHYDNPQGSKRESTVMTLDPAKDQQSKSSIEKISNGY